MENRLYIIFKKHIEGTEEKAVVAEIILHLTNLTLIVAKVAGLSDIKVYITSRVLKHLYDKKPAEEFQFILNHLIEIVKYPKYIYRNKGSKRGSICVVTEIKNKSYLCSIEVVINKNYIVTVFRIRDSSYLKNYEILWSRKDGSPSS